MAKAQELVPFIRKWEGGYVNDPYDRGGETNMGITIGTWRGAGYDCTEKIEQITVKNSSGRNVVYSNVTRSLYEMTEEQWLSVFRKLYWDRWLADQIGSQPIANILVDWVWASGVWGIKIPQRVLGVTQDGIVGQRTLTALNGRDCGELFETIYRERVRYIDNICIKTPANERFRKGWMNRLEDLRDYSLR